MAEVTALEIVRSLYEYHWWANRRLFDVAAGWGKGWPAATSASSSASRPCCACFAHLYADWG